MFAIFKKEMRSYFINPIGFVFVGIFLALSSLLCCYTTIQSNSYSTSTYFYYMIFAFVILIPILTMRSFAEERKMRTEQMLLTAPVTITGMVMGKYLAALTLFVGTVDEVILYKHACKRIGIDHFVHQIALIMEGEAQILDETFALCLFSKIDKLERKNFFFPIGAIHRMEMVEINTIHIKSAKLLVQMPLEIICSLHIPHGKLGGYIYLIANAEGFESAVESADVDPLEL